MDLGIIIPTFNRKEHLSDLLGKLFDQKNAPYFSVYVIDDGSSDGTAEMLKNFFPQVRIVTGNGNWWWTKCINEGLKKALEEKKDTFLLMNDDTLIDENFLSKYSNIYTENEKGILGAISITVERPYRIFYSGLKSINWLTAKWKRYHNFFHEYSSDIKGCHYTVFIPGRGMIFNKNVYDKIGFFSENKFPQYYADYDYSYRAYKAGFNTQISWDCPIYSYVKLTGKGSKTNSGFGKFLLGFFNPMASHSLKRTFQFYIRHAGPFFIIGFCIHIMRLIAAYIVQKSRRLI